MKFVLYYSLFAQFFFYLMLSPTHSLSIFPNKLNIAARWLNTQFLCMTMNYYRFIFVHSKNMIVFTFDLH